MRIPKTEKKESGIRTIAIGVLLAVLVMLATAAAGAALVNAEKVELSDADPMLLLAGAAVGCLLTGWFVSSNIKTKQFLSGLASAGLVFALRLIIRAFSGEGSVFDPVTLKMLLACAAGGTAGAILGVRRKKKHRRAHTQRS